MALSKGISLLNGKTSLAALGVADLDFNVLVDGLPVRKVGLGQIPLQGLGESALPDGGADGSTDGATDVAEDVEESESTGGVLVVGSGQDGDLHDDD